jgi:predicted RNA-binding Zn ribbon-like protein
VPSDRPSPPEHELAFRWRGGRAVLNFTATVGERWRRGFERLREPEDLGRWLQEAQLLDAPVAVSPKQLRMARILREAIYRLFISMQGTASAAPADVEQVNLWAAGGADVLVLTPEGRLSSRPADSVEEALRTLAREAVELLGGPLAGRVKECGREDCGLLFLDESRARSRRWCSMDTCGSRSKMQAYRARKRSRS